MTRIKKGPDILICPKCGYIEPYSHDEALVTCDCKSPSITYEEFTKYVEEAVNKLKQRKKPS